MKQATIQEFEVDRKLDNRRESVQAFLVKFSYTWGDMAILREVVEYKSKSGYCLDPVESTQEYVSFDDIGVVQRYRSCNTGAMNPRFKIYAYLHKEGDALANLISEITDKLTRSKEIVGSIEKALACAASVGLLKSNQAT